eukprot:TRINITY_DN12629_c0_g1_i1.p1 TRINITY_DN12629_c0_g1~~TRINITY_DN12629_c0_g1_i1.p1  ORF type:complete len:367 (-),score=36.24 TRINITY_DN12629_c0_g1_i1:80-1180(-)
MGEYQFHSAEALIHGSEHDDVGHMSVSGRSSPLDFLAHASANAKVDVPLSKWRITSMTDAGKITVVAGPGGSSVQLHKTTVKVSPDPSKPQAKKCRNRECNNLGGQAGKPRSIYCSKRCQSREQNLRQGRIKNPKPTGTSSRSTRAESRSPPSSPNDSPVSSSSPSPVVEQTFTPPSPKTQPVVHQPIQQPPQQQFQPPRPQQVNATHNNSHQINHPHAHSQNQHSQPRHPEPMMHQYHPPPVSSPPLSARYDPTYDVIGALSPSPIPRLGLTPPPISMTPPPFSMTPSPILGLSSHPLQFLPVSIAPSTYDNDNGYFPTPALHRPQPITTRRPTGPNQTNAVFTPPVVIKKDKGDDLRLAPMMRE